MSDTDTLSVSRLISLVRERPVLWDRQEEVYKNRKLTRKAWAEICEALIDNYDELNDQEKQAVGRSVIGKWANLRDNWLRYWRKTQELQVVGSSTSTKSLKKYIHHDQLLFLSKVYDPGVAQEVEEIQVDVDILSDPEEESPLGVSSDETSQNLWTLPVVVDKSEQTRLDPQPDRHVYFFQSIMPMIYDFDDDQILDFHAGVLECLRRVKYRFPKQEFRPPAFLVFSQPQDSVGNKDIGSKMASKGTDTGETFNVPIQQILLKQPSEEQKNCVPAKKTSLAVGVPPVCNKEEEKQELKAKPVVILSTEKPTDCNFTNLNEVIPGNTFTSCPDGALPSILRNSLQNTGVTPQEVCCLPALETMASGPSSDTKENDSVADDICGHTHSLQENCILKREAADTLNHLVTPARTSRINTPRSSKSEIRKYSRITTRSRAEPDESQQLSKRMYFNIMSQTDN